MMNNVASNTDTNNSSCNDVNTKKSIVSEEEEEDDMEPSYVISGDIDVDDDVWLVEDANDNEITTRPSTSSKHVSFLCFWYITPL